MIERITGPIRGYFVAFYADEFSQSGESLAYYKICAGTPDSYWGAPCLLKDGIPRSCASDEEALRAAQEMARLQIGNLPPADQLAAARENRPMYSFELQQYGALD